VKKQKNRVPAKGGGLVGGVSGETSKRGKRLFGGGGTIELPASGELGTGRGKKASAPSLTKHIDLIRPDGIKSLIWVPKTAERKSVTESKRNRIRTSGRWPHNLLNAEWRFRMKRRQGNAHTTHTKQGSKADTVNSQQNLKT